MRLRAEHPVTWPGERAWTAWWRHELRDLHESTVGADGLVELDPPSANLQVELTQGQHLRPGALYEARMPHVTVGVAAGGVAGHAGRRQLHGQYRDLRDDARVVVDVDSLDSFASIRSTSTLEHLRWTLSLVASPEELLDVDLQLDWLRLRISARVERGGAGEQLVVDVTVNGSGVWRPVLAPLLSMVSRPLAREVERSVAEAAESLTDLHLAPGETGQTRARRREERDVQVAAALMRSRAQAVAEQVERRPWWRGRGESRWLAALADLPQPTWPDRGSHGDWSLAETSILRTYLRTHRRSHPPTWVGDELERQRHATWAHVDQLIATREAEQAAADPVPQLDDALLDLGWLAGPWSTARHLMKAGSDAEAEASVRAALREVVAEDADNRP